MQSVSAEVSALNSSAGHQPRQVRGVDVLPGEVAGHLAAGQQQEPVADQVRVARVVGHEQDRQALARGPPRSPAAPASAGPTVIGAVGSSTTSARAPKCSARAIARLCRSPACSVLAGWSGSRPVTPTRAIALHGDLPRPVDVEPPERPHAAGRLGAEEEVPPDRQQRAPPRGPARPWRCRPPGPAAASGSAPARRRSSSCALVVPAQPGQHRDQRRLARPVLAEHAGDLPGRAASALTRESARHAAVADASARAVPARVAGAPSAVTTGAPPSAGSRTTPLASSATSSSTPRNAWNQGGSQPASAMPSRATA